MELKRPKAEEVAKANAAITEAVLVEMKASGFGPQVEALHVLKAATMPLSDAELAALNGEDLGYIAGFLARGGR